jgi:hypothetical protein
MWLTVILLFLLVPVSWIGLLISWSAWMLYFETGKAIEPDYLGPLGLFSFGYVCLQIYLLIAKAKDMVDRGEGPILFSMTFLAVLMLTVLIMLFG